MTKLFILLALVSVCGCSSAKLMRCPAKAIDSALYTCSESVEGVYRKCEKPVDLYTCEIPQ